MPTIPHPQSPVIFQFEIAVEKIIAYLQRCYGKPVSAETLFHWITTNGDVFPDWHLVLREGTRQCLHLNVGTPGIDEPEEPIEENPLALYSALVLGCQSMPVIISGQLEIAVEEGLLREEVLVELRRQIEEFL